MNILFYEDYINPLTGGVQRVSYNVAKSLRVKGIRSFVAHRCDDSLEILDEYVYEEEIRITGYPNDDIKKLIHFICKNQIGIIINQRADSINDTKLLYKIKNIVGIPLFSFMHLAPTNTRDSYKHKDLRFPKVYLRSLVKQFIFYFYKIDKKVLSYTYKRSDKVVWLSSAFYPDIEYVLRQKLDMKKFYAIPNSVTYSEPIRLKEWQNKEKIVLVVSRINEIQKRLSRVLDIWNLLFNKLPDWKLLIVGDGEQLDDYKRLSVKMDLKNIFFEGQQNPLSYYKKASVFFMTSVAEAFPMTILEAQQMGVVPIAFNSYKSVHDIITDGENGYVIENDNIKKFAEKACLLMTNFDIWKDLSEKAIESTKRFSQDIIADLWYKLLTE
ncbi:MAG: glycosyltransferase [Bacteroidales bacterium]|jgi:glycosyltransferase involved in cell wall biosynthesis|nr:glycosyltransferase [Bacteroidales bacterium]